MFADFKSTAILPAVESEVAEVIGRGAAIRLSRRICFRNPYRKGAGKHAGVRGVLSVPARCSDAFIEKVGNRADAEALSDHFGGEMLELTGCNIALAQAHHHAIRFLHRKGARKSTIAKVAGMTQRHVRRICAGVPIEEKAPDEFFPHHFRAVYAFSVLLAQNPLTGKRKYVR